MNTDLKIFSLKELFTKLHDNMKTFIADTKNALDRNNDVSFEDIKRMREHITQRLNHGENIEDNEALLKVLNLFTMDKAFLNVTKEESEEWLDFIEAIEASVKDFDKYAATSEERHDIEEINKVLSEAKSLLRK